MKLNRKASFIIACALGFALVAISPTSVIAQVRKSSSTQVRAVTIGKLIRAGRTQHGKPKFALLDDEGNIASHVVPVAGLNLSKYLNQQVGVTARSATRGRDNLPYVLASKVTLLDQIQKDQTTNSNEMKSIVSKRTKANAKPKIQDESQLELQSPAEPDLFADLEIETVPTEDSNEESFDLPEIVNAKPHPMKRGDLQDFNDLSIAEDEEIEVVGAAVLDSGEELPQSIVVENDIAPSETIIEGNFHHHDCPGCSQCGGGANCLPPECCPVGPSGRYWFRGEYLLWWTKGMDLPALVSTSPSNTPASQAGVRGQTGTSILFGDESVLEDSRNGGRFRLGKWLDHCQWLGIEAEYFFISEDDAGFSQTSTGAPILARPFFNTNLNQEDSELIAFPGTVSGVINVRASSELHSFAPRIRMNLCSTSFMCDPAYACTHPNGCGGVMCGHPGGQRLDFILGYRYYGLEEALTVGETLAADQNGVPTTFLVNDSFQTENYFHGAELGLQWERYRGPWSLELLGKVALGNNREIVTINGNTTSSANGVNFGDTGGILALSSNIGEYENDSFAAIPEFGATIGYKIAPDLRFTVGYTFIYWSDVVRPGDQIDLNVNPDLIPPEQATTGTQTPAFVLNETDFWMQGLSFGLDYRW